MTHSPILLAISGATGRMGQMLVRSASQSPFFRLTQVLVRDGSPKIGTDCLPALTYTSTLTETANLLIDFTSPQATLTLLPLCLKYQIKMVIGTTGFQPEELKRLEVATQTIPILWTSNMSLGANLLRQLAKLSATFLPQDYDIEIVEAHHRHKKDAPSGTALTLAKTLLDTTRRPIERLQYGRQGFQPRSPQEIGIHAVRLGGVVGEHTVYFANETEKIELTHQVLSREAFAQGALVAAQFLQNQSSGWYSMDDVFKTLFS